MAEFPQIDNRSYQEVYGYSPLDEFNNTADWRTERRGALAPLVDAQIGYDAMVKQNQHNMALAQYQNEYNTEQWDRQNEYNSPKATMQRLVEAGINPRAYSQVGQFANAGAPQPASSYEYKEPASETAKYVESESLRLQRKQMRLRQLELSNALLKESMQYKINKDRNSEIYRHNTAMEAVKNFYMMFDDNKFRYGLAKSGVVLNDDGTFDIPVGDLRLDERTKLQTLLNLQKAGVKLQTEDEYLQLKKSLETIKTGNATLDSIVKLLQLIL